MLYDEIQDERDAALRRAILDAATSLLVHEGISALSLRRIATQVGCSTTVLYTHFGGKQGLVEALWVEGFDRLWRFESTAMASGDPLGRLTALGWAYRAHALESPDYYRVMFGGVVPGFSPSPTALQRSRATFQVLVDAVRDCIEAGVFHPENPEEIATVLWATVHGVVSLQLAGNLNDAVGEGIFGRALRAVGAGFLTGPPAASSAGAASSQGEPELAVEPQMEV